MSEEEKEEHEEEKAPKKGGNKKRLLLLVVIIGLVLGGGGLFGLKLMAGKSADAGGDGAHDSGHGEAKTDGHGEAKKDEHGGHGGHGAEAEKEGSAAEKVRAGTGNFKEIKPPIVVNVKDSYGTRLIRAEIHFEYLNEKVLKEIEANNVKIRDKLLDLIGNVKIEEIDSQAGRNQLRAKLLKEVNLILKDGQIQQVYFTEFLIK